MPTKLKGPVAVVPQVHLNCDCGNAGMVRILHWQKVRCVCNKVWWALQPKKNGPLKLFPWPGDWTTIVKQSWDIRLTDDDLRQAQADAKAKLEDCDRKGCKDIFTTESWGSSNFENETNSRLGEIAASKRLGLPLHAAYGNEKGPDIGDNVQVRTTHWPTGRLIIRPKNTHPTHFYVLVLGTFPLFRLAGWIHATEGMKDQFIFKRKESSNWEITQPFLHPMDTFKP